MPDTPTQPQEESSAPLADGRRFAALRRCVAAFRDGDGLHQTARTLALSAFIISLLSMAVLQAWPTLGSFGVVLALTLGAMSVHLALTATSLSPRHGPDPLDQRLEKLQDLRWELRESETRYRELLDSIEDVIVRRDPAGNITFANRAFCRMFGIEPQDCLGIRWAAPVLETLEEALPHPGGSPRRCEMLATAQGTPRWIEWEDHTVPVAANHATETQSVGRDVTERITYEEQLRQARDAADAANRAKSRFLATMSHEIRTPMNGILGMAGLLEDGSLTPEQATYTRAIDVSARNLLSLIDEILDFSKIEAGKLVLVNEPFSITQTVQSAVELLAPRAHEKKLDIAAQIAPDVPKLVMGDPVRVRQIVLNLLSNAVKFTDRGSVSIAVVTEDRGSRAHVTFTVEDTGIGLSTADKSRLFAEFEQADSALQRREGGTGLGLAITKRLARAMDGDISVHSRLGTGSEFRVALPFDVLAPAVPLALSGASHHVLLAFARPKERASLAASLDAAGISSVEALPENALEAIEYAARSGRPFDRIIVDEAEGAGAMGELLACARALAPETAVRGIVLINVLARAGLTPFRKHGFDAYLTRPVRPQSLLEQVGAAPPAARAVPREPAAPPVTPVLKAHVLLAEDNAINALLATRVLERAGATVFHAANGAAAISAVEASLRPDGRPFDLILMDIFMPGMDGVETAAEIRRMFPAGRCPPVIALTANAFAEDRQRYLELGLDDYLAKPFEAVSMTQLLGRWLAKSRLDPAA